VHITENLKPGVQCAKAASKAMSILGLIKRNFKVTDKEDFLLLFKTYSITHGLSAEFGHRVLKGGYASTALPRRRRREDANWNRAKGNAEKTERQENLLGNMKGRNHSHQKGHSHLLTEDMQAQLPTSNGTTVCIHGNMSANAGYVIYYPLTNC
jgi:hypothetical protein